MKKLLLISILTFISSFIIAQNSLPAQKVKNKAGEMVSLNDYIDNSKPMIISFWSTVCKPCISELDAITDNYEEWNKEYPFTFIAVSIDDARFAARVWSMSGGRGWSAIILADQNGDLKRAMNVTSTPAVFVVDKDGKMIYNKTGYVQGGEYELYEKIKDLYNKDSKDEK